MPEIPDKGFIGATTATANPFSGGGAVAAAASLGALGKELAGMGQQGYQIAMELQTAKNAEVENKIINEWDSSLAEFEAKEMTNHDPEKRISNLDTRAKELHSKITDAPYMPPVVRERLEATFSRTITKAKNRALMQSAQLMVEKNKSEMGLRLDRARKGLSAEDARQVTADAVANGSMKPWEKARVDAETEEEIRREKEKIAINSDPGAWLEANPKPRKGVPVGEFKASQRMARGLLREKQREESADVLDQIYEGKIKSAEEIKTATPNLGARARARLLEEADRVADAEFRKEMESPEYQARIAGEVGDLLEGYKPTGENEDVTLLRIQQKIRHMKPGLLKDRYEARLMDIHAAAKQGREAQAAEIKTVKDWAFTQIKEHKKAGLFKRPAPKEPHGTSLRSVLDDGILTDKGKLLRFGYTEEQAHEITVAAQKEAAALKEGDSYDGPKSLDLFRLYWNETNAAEEDFPALDRAVFQAIRDGKGPSHMVVDPVEAAKHETALRQHKHQEAQAFGEAQRQLTEYLQTNPEADQKELQGYLEGLNIHIDAGPTNSDWAPAKPRTRADSVEGSPALSSVGSFKVFTGSRDQMSGFSSAPGSRKISLDFNDAENKAARGIEIVVPSGASDEEVAHAKAYAKATQAFLKSKGVVVPLRGDEGIALKSNGSRRHGRGGVFHTEPFFASNTAARNAIMSDPEGYARVLGATLGKIPGTTFIAPHTLPGAKDRNPGPGASSGEFSERSFAMNVILPALLKVSNS